MSTPKNSFVVSARKYRPAQWSEVIGQEAITDTLRNSIEQGHMAHAYLFCGPRGVGKTTCARIFAKEINKGESHDDDEDFSFNIFELDAASNNKVDDIRNLTDQVRIPPQVGEYKVYIIDEVHMLSTQAFNAFLKTLEEPPKHAIFILATTEKHKIIPTILSRCQIYDFNRIPVEQIVDHLQKITLKESIKAEEEALHVIAQKADGALRDALSIFDQLVSFTNGNLTYDAVLRNLHVLDYDYYFKLVDFLFEADYPNAILLLDEILKLGFDPNHFLAGLGSHLRDLMVCQDEKTVVLLEVGQSVRQRYLDQAKKLNPDWLLASLAECQRVDARIKGSTNQRLLLEVALLTIAGWTIEKKKPSLENREPQNTIKEPHTPQLETSKKKAKTEEIKEHAPEGGLEKSTKELPSSEKEIGSIKSPTEQVEQKSVVPSIEIEEKVVRTQKKRKRPSTISLKIDDPDHIAEIVDQPLPNNEIEITDTLSLSEAWRIALDNAQSNGFNAFLTIMKRVDIDQDVQDNTIHVRLGHNVEEEEFGLHSADFLQDLRLKTGNSELKITTEVSEIKTDSKLFTPKEKFEHLANKNPSLIKLKQDLDLDIAY